MGTSCHILGCLSGKEKKNLKMQALGLGMCPVIIHITQEREFRLCFVTLRCGLEGAHRKTTLVSRGTSSLIKILNQRQANLPSAVSAPLPGWTTYSFLGTQFQKFDPWVGEWDLDDLLELSQPEDSSSDHHARQLTFCLILFGDGVSLCSLGCPPTLHLLALSC